MYTHAIHPVLDPEQFLTVNEGSVISDIPSGARPLLLVVELPAALVGDVQSSVAILEVWLATY